MKCLMRFRLSLFLSTEAVITTAGEDTGPGDRIVMPISLLEVIPIMEIISMGRNRGSRIHKIRFGGMTVIVGVAGGVVTPGESLSIAKFLSMKGYFPSFFLLLFFTNCHVHLVAFFLFYISCRRPFVPVNHNPLPSFANDSGSSQMNDNKRPREQLGGDALKNEVDWLEFKIESEIKKVCIINICVLVM